MIQHLIFQSEGIFLAKRIVVSTEYDEVLPGTRIPKSFNGESPKGAFLLLKPSLWQSKTVSTHVISPTLPDFPQVPLPMPRCSLASWLSTDESRITDLQNSVGSYREMVCGSDFIGMHMHHKQSFLL